MFEQMQASPRPETFAEREPDEGPGLASRAWSGLQAVHQRVINAPMPEPDSALYDTLTDPVSLAARTMHAMRKERFSEMLNSEALSTEEAYTRRIKAVKEATGDELQNPLYGGYLTEAMTRLRADRRAGIYGTGGPRDYQQRIYDEKVRALLDKHPELKDILGRDIKDEAKSIAHEAETAPVPAVSNPGLGLAADFAGSMWAHTRDPLFVGSLFFGPVGATGKTALAQAANAGLRQAAYNVGLTIAEQPAVQAWRAEIGARSGIQPALEHVGMAAIGGFIPGFGLHMIGSSLAREAPALIKEATPAIDRVLAGKAEPGDATAIADVLEVMQRAHEAQQEALAAAKPGFNVYHGSPHDFERFDLSHIGAGEGAQSFGHGLYFAEKRGVAESYKPAGVNRSASSAAETLAVSHMARGNTAADLRKLAESQRSLGATGETYDQAASLIESGAVKAPLLYRARILADKEHFLDWDKPLSEQPESILGKLATVAGTTADKLKQSSSQTGDWLDAMGGGAHGFAFSDPKEMSAALREAGIPGIKYLDQGSRDAGDGTRNYVVFDDKLIQVTHKNDVPVEIRALRMGEDMLAADRAAAGEHPPAVPDEVLAAELKRADDPSAPSGQAVEAVNAMRDGKPLDPEIAEHVHAARPQTEQEAQVAADEALDIIGRKRGVADLQTTMASLDAARTAAMSAREARALVEEAPKLPRGDKAGLTPFIDDKGNIVLMSDREIAKLGNKEAETAMLIRECK